MASAVISVGYTHEGIVAERGRPMRNVARALFSAQTTAG